MLATMKSRFILFSVLLEVFHNKKEDPQTEVKDHYNYKPGFMEHKMKRIHNFLIFFSK